MKNSFEQSARNSHLGHLKRHITRMGHDLGAYLDQLFSQCRQGPMVHTLYTRNVQPMICSVSSSYSILLIPLSCPALYNTTSAVLLGTLLPPLLTAIIRYSNWTLRG